MGSASSSSVRAKRLLLAAIYSSAVSAASVSTVQPISRAAHAPALASPRQVMMLCDSSAEAEASDAQIMAAALQVMTRRHPRPPWR